MTGSRGGNELLHAVDDLVDFKGSSVFCTFVKFFFSVFIFDRIALHLRDKVLSWL